MILSSYPRPTKKKKRKKKSPNHKLVHHVGNSNKGLEPICSFTPELFPMGSKFLGKRVELPSS
jgi:hypothetical protein